jgi:capsular exopolysaccharide synthesis family protein
MLAADVASPRSSDEVPLHDLIAALRRRLPIILVAAILLASGTLAYSLKSQKQYTSTAKLLFRDPGFDQKLFGSSILAPSNDPDREAATNVSLVSLDTISERTARALPAASLTESQIRAKVEVAAEGRSNVVAVMATDPKPEFAATLANTMARQYIEFRRAADRSKITDAVNLVRRQRNALSPERRVGSDGRSATQRIDELQVLASLQTGNAELVQPAQTPRSASSPKTLRNTLIAFLLGLVLGVLIALLRDRVDRRLRHGNDAEAILDRPILGSIPESRNLRKPDPESLTLAGPEGEAFRTLRTNLRYFAIDQDVKSMLMTSASPGDGKSTIARYLAATAAASNVRVVLLEADLRKPTLAGALPSLFTTGLTDVLAGSVPLCDVIQRVPLAFARQHAPHSESTGPTLDVITAGPTPPNPTDLLESDRMLEVIAQLEARYSLVIIDSSPLTVVPDAIPIASRVSGVLVVVREGKSTSTGTRHLRKQLDNLKITPLGIIVNAASLKNDSGYYGYYGYRSPPTAANPAAGAVNGASAADPDKTGAR